MSSLWSVIVAELKSLHYKCWIRNRGYISGIFLILFLWQIYLVGTSFVQDVDFETEKRCTTGDKVTFLVLNPNPSGTILGRVILPYTWTTDDGVIKLNSN
jgi:hypothetical protein